MDFKQWHDQATRDEIKQLAGKALTPPRTLQKMVCHKVIFSHPGFLRDLARASEEVTPDRVLDVDLLFQHYLKEGCA